MSLPIPDGPDPSTTLPNGVGVDAGFTASPVGPTLCGFGLPGFTWNLTIPPLPFPDVDFPPAWFFALALKCDLANPIQLDAGLAKRSGTPGLDKDPEDE